MCWRGIEPGTQLCPACGADLGDPAVVRLGELDVRMSELATRARELAAEREVLVAELRRGLVPPPPAVGLAPPPAPGEVTRGEWRPASLGILLLWVGVALLALAGLIFAVVAWPDLGDGARAVILVVATAATGGVSVVLHRRLPVTSESLAVLFIALLLVDCQALWQAGAGNDLDTQLWWSIGLAVTGIVAVAIGAVADQKVPRVAAGVLLPISGFVLVTWAAHTPYAAGIGLSIVVTVAFAAAMAVDRADGWGGLVAAMVTVGMLLWFIALAMTIGGTSNESLAYGVRSAAGVVLLGLPLGALRVGFEKVRTDRSLDGLLGAMMALLGVWAVGDVLAVGLATDGLWVAVALIGATVLVMSGVLSGRLRAGWLAAGIAVIGTATAPVGVMTLFVLGRLPVAVTPAWHGSLDTSVPDLVIPTQVSGELDLPTSDVRAAVAVLAVLAVLTGLEALDLGGRTRRLGSAGAAGIGGLVAGAAVVLVPVAIPLTALGTISMLATLTVVATAGSLVIGREHGASERSSVSMLAFAAWAWGLCVTWSLLGRWATVAVIGAGAVLGLVVSVLRRTPSARAGFAAVATAVVLVEAGTVAAALRADASVVGFAIAATGGAVVLVWATLGQPGTVRGPSEVFAIVGMAIGTLIAWGAEMSWGAGALTFMVPVFAAASLRDNRIAYRWVATALAVVAWWAWLGAYDVTVVEIYTLPAATVALAAGWTQRRTEAGSHSWLAYGPGLVLALIPTLALVLSGEQATRAVLLAVGAIVVTGVGVVRRLQAPVLMGVVTLLVLALDTLWPVAAQVPRWALIGAAGALFVWIGATFEHRRRDLRRVGHTLGGLH